MVNALLVECRTRTACHPNNTAAPTNGEQGETQMETDQGQKAATETEEPAVNHTEEEVKKQERERREREARKEKEARERERKERERRAWEKERARKEKERDERARREREKREEERREWERRERARRERKRAYGEGSSGLRSSGRLEGYRQSSWRDEHYNNSEAETRMVRRRFQVKKCWRVTSLICSYRQPFVLSCNQVREEQEEEEFDEFPFNMSDFVTVDEVGDVTDLPRSPSPTVPMETTEGREDTPTSVQKDAPGVHFSCYAAYHKKEFLYMVTGVTET